jgi:hypothetical protein
MSGIFDLILDHPLETWGQKFLHALENEAAEPVLLGLCFALKLKCAVDHDFRRNIDRFYGQYQFISKTGHLKVVLEFDHGQVRFREGLGDKPNATIFFKDGASLVRFIIARKKDILQAMLRNELEAKGNLNYIFKLGFMANHLDREFQALLPLPG